MADSYIGEVRAVGFNWAPELWAICFGQHMSISQNQALFAILGTTFGGNGRTNFGIPPLVGRTPMGVGTAPGLTPRSLGQKAGMYKVPLSISAMPPHNHTLYSRFTLDPTTYSHAPEGHYLSRKGLDAAFIFKNDPPGSGQLTMSDSSIGVTGASSGHENRQPYLAVNFVISLWGTFPPRS